MIDIPDYKTVAGQSFLKGSLGKNDLPLVYFGRTVFRKNAQPEISMVFGGGLL